MYSEQIMKHFENPRNVGEIHDADGTGSVGDPQCGDYLKVFIKVEDDRLKQVTFKIVGCPAAIATSSVLTEMATGMSLDEAVEITELDVALALGGLPPLKMHCSNLSVDALRAAVWDYVMRGSRA